MANTLQNAFSPSGTGCFIIGEIGVNHNGDVKIAKDLIDIAFTAGADAVKFQTFSAERLVTRTAKKADYQSRNHKVDESQFDMLKNLELSEDDLRTCKAYCDEKRIIFLSTPFDEDSADLLQKIDVAGFKISSGDLTNLPLLRHIAAKGLPMIISTGMATMGEVEDAVVAIRNAGDPAVSILHCVSNYPAEAAEANLAAMDTIAQAFNKVVGWSDHTLGDAISVAAVARGARIIEKHFTLDVAMEGPDHKASLNPSEFTELLTKIRLVESAIGDGVKRPHPSEISTAEVARRSIVAARDIRSGETIANVDLIMKRPGTGLAPKHAEWVVGRKASRNIAAETLISISDFG